jgi:hypothetical protein
MARQLSFAGVGFDIKDVCLSQEFIKMYDSAVKLVSTTINYIHFVIMYASCNLIG